MASRRARAPIVAWSRDDIDRAAVLPAEFYEPSALIVAPRLLGKILVHRTREGMAAGRIVEVEAYCGPEDQAAHTANGRRTPRNEVMWGPAAHSYVYFVYGMHWCFNVVTGGEGVPHAVLIRGLDPVHGFDLMRHRRGPKVEDSRLLRGPANACKALGLDGSANGHDLLDGSLSILDAPEPSPRSIKRTPRIGVGYAGIDAMRRWRFFIADAPGVS